MQAEREVDRIEIFERRRQERQVEREEDGGEQPRNSEASAWPRRSGSRRPQQQAFVQAAGAVALQIERDVAGSRAPSARARSRG